MFSNSLTCKLYLLQCCIWCCFFSLSFWQIPNKVQTAPIGKPNNGGIMAYYHPVADIYERQTANFWVWLNPNKRGKVASSAHLIPWKKVYSDFWNGFFKFSTKIQQLSTFATLIFLIPRNIHLGVMRLTWKI